MLLCVDVGNTTLHLGLFEGERLVHTARCSGDDVLELERFWHEHVEAPLGRISLEGAVLCSVNPKVKIPFCHWAAQRFGTRPLVVGEGLRLPMRLEVDDPAEVGADRIVNAFAAWRLHDAGPIVIADFGTAFTLDVVGADGAYHGGVIAPGVETAARALADRTALLPYVRVEPVEHAIGRNTIDALRGGLWFGLQGLVEALCRQVASELEAEPRWIATGGDARRLVERIPLPFEIRPALTLEGLARAWRETQR